MTQEDKELLLKDLTARLPYVVKAILSEYHIDEFPYNGTYCDKVINLGICGSTINLLNHIEKYGVRPYLRLISSMSEEEEKEFVSFTDTMFRYGKDNDLCCLPLDAISWLNKHHFDYRGLIKKGLALEAPDGMYK